MARLKNPHEEAVSAEAELDALRAAAEMATEEHDAAFAKVSEERQEEVEAWKATTSRGEATLVKVFGETSAEVNKLRSERDSAAASHHELLAFICRAV